jgi:hypothetical protein
MIVCTVKMSSWDLSDDGGSWRGGNSGGGDGGKGGGGRNDCCGTSLRL